MNLLTSMLSGQQTYISGGLLTIFFLPGEGVRQAPHRPGRELRILRFEVQPVDLGQQTSGRLKLGVDKCRVDDQLRRIIGDLSLPPGLHLALLRFEVPLNPVHADRECINQAEALGVLG